jgi:mercuric reductase
MSDCCKHNSEINTSPDILIIGGGSGGFSAAITAAEQGVSVVVIGDGTIGGTCVNVGCVPSKTMIRAVEALYQTKHASRFNGIQAQANITDWKLLVAQKQALVDDLRHAKYIDVLPSYPNVKYIEGIAKFTNNSIEHDGNLYTPKKTIIATGSSNSLPSIDGIDSVPYLTSTTALELEVLPKSLLIIGGGVIGIELGQLFARAGVEVTVCCRSRIVPTSEPEISEALEQYLKNEGINICQGLSYQTINQTKQGIQLTCGDRILQAEQLLVASGRKPNISKLTLNEANIKTNENDGIEVNEYMQTSHPDVYAVGDVTGLDMFVYMAAYGGKLAALNCVNGNSLVYDNQAMPEVIFSDPQVSGVGLTEQQARSQGYQVKTSTITLDHVPRFIVARDTRGLIKLIADKETDLLLGAHILAPEAGDLIQTIVIAMKSKITTKGLADTIFPYLTAVEGIKLAAQTFDKDVSKLSCCAG